jgi:GntR family transcriptional regulator
LSVFCCKNKFVAKTKTQEYTNCNSIVSTVDTGNTDTSLKRKEMIADMFELDLRSRKPIYEQLVDKLKELIINDILKPDEQLPSVRQLASEISINPNTIQKAFRELENQGYSYTVPGKGSFVNSDLQEKKAIKIARIKEEISKPIAEALFLGVTKEQMMQFITEIENGLDNVSQSQSLKEGK